MNIKAIFFDMDNTLVHLPNFSSEEFFLKILKRFGFHFEIEQVEQAYQSLDGWVKQNLADYTRRGRELYLEWNRLLLKALGIQDLEALTERVEDCWENSLLADEQLYPEVREVLDLLFKNGLLLGVVSNRYPELIDKSVHKHEMAHYFCCLVSPKDANALRGKLDGQMWELALNVVGVAASEAAHVGDSYPDDVLGARQAGLFPIMIDREGKYGDVDCLKIRNLKELFRILDISNLR